MQLLKRIMRMVVGGGKDVQELHDDQHQRLRFRDEAASDIGRRPEYRLEYMKQLIDVVKEDVKHVFLNVSLCLAAMAILLSQSELRAQPIDALSVKLAYVLSLLLFLVSAAFYFSYLRSLHILHMRLARNILALDVFRARELFAGELGVWRHNGWKYVAGRGVMLLAFIFLAYDVCSKLFPEIPCRLEYLIGF